MIRRCLRCARCYPDPLGEHITERKAAFLPKLGSCTVNLYFVWLFSHHEDKFPDECDDIENPKNVLVIGGDVGGLINFSEFSEHKQDIWNFVNEIVEELKARTVEIKLNI